MHLANCLCSSLSTIDLPTRIVVIMHHREWPKPTSTARLFALAYSNCEIRIRGEKESPFEPDGVLQADKQNLLLFPSEDAQILSSDLVAKDPRPVNLIVPDGSWRQANKMGQREPILRNLPRVVLPDMGPSRYKLRNEPQPGGLATFEAMARAIRILENEDAYLTLQKLFETMVERTLATRGRRLLSPQHES
jgi:DTW domain-containing protein YfiP